MSLLPQHVIQYSFPFHHKLSHIPLQPRSLPSSLLSSPAWKQLLSLPNSFFHSPLITIPPPVVRPSFFLFPSLLSLSLSLSLSWYGTFPPQFLIPSQYCVPLFTSSPHPVLLRAHTYTARLPPSLCISSLLKYYPHPTCLTLSTSHHLFLLLLSLPPLAPHTPP